MKISNFFDRLIHKKGQFIFPDELNQTNIIRVLNHIVTDKKLTIQCRQKIAEAIIAQQNNNSGN